MKFCPICDRTYDDAAAFCEVDGSVLRDPRSAQDDFVGREIKRRYRILEKLGEGGMAVVYLAEQINIERKVALKVLQGRYARDEEFVRRFRQEAKLAASLNHPNVIQIYDFDQGDDGSLFITMEYLRGESLKQIIQKGPFDLGRAVRLGVQIADGLGAAHRAGVIHRDIKPENIMVVKASDEIKLMDFGIARLMQTGPSTRLTRAGMMMGTPAYMSPEQIEGKEVSEATDIYAFGIVLYHMLSGQVPFDAPTPAAVLMKHLNETPVPLKKLRHEVPVSLERIVTQCLQKKPERRPANMQEVAVALKQAASKLPLEKPAQRVQATQVLEPIRPVATSLTALGAVSRWFAYSKSLLTMTSKRREVGEPHETELYRQGTHIVDDGDIRERRGPAEKTIAETILATQSLSRAGGQAARLDWRWIGAGAGVVLVGMMGVAFYFQVERAGVQTADSVIVDDKPSPSALPEDKVVALEIIGGRRELAPRERFGTRLKVRYEGGKQEEKTEGVEWGTSDPDVLRVDAAGEIEARAVGGAELTARYKGLVAPPLRVTVREPKPLIAKETASRAPMPAPQLVSLKVVGHKKEIQVNERVNLRAIGRYSDERQEEMKKGVEWDSSDKSVAMVNTRGELEGRKEGKAEIVARYGRLASEPLSLVVKSLSRKEPPVGKEPEVSREPVIVKEADVSKHIKLARSYRERGEYTEALVELEKAKKADSGNREVLTEISITKRACNAERTLGRTNLKC